MKYLILIFVLVAGCNSQRKNIEASNEKPSENKSSQINRARITFSEVFRIPDIETLQFFRNLTPIKKFTPFTELDMGSYQRNILGVTTEEESKSHILSQLNKIDSLSQNAILTWSKYKEVNNQTGEEAYYLYMLKKTDLNLGDINIEKIEYRKSAYLEEYEILGEFDQIGTEKWIELTKKAYEDNNNYVAVVINNEVYSCPYVAAPLESGHFSFGVKTESEAKSIVGSLKNKSR